MALALLVIAAAATATLPAVVWAQPAYLVRDIRLDDPGAFDGWGGDNLARPVVHGGVLYFVADDGERGF